jgi:hypothetical protein
MASAAETPAHHHGPLEVRHGRRLLRPGSSIGPCRPDWQPDQLGRLDLQHGRDLGDDLQPRIARALVQLRARSTAPFDRSGTSPCAIGEGEGADSAAPDGPSTHEGGAGRGSRASVTTEQVKRCRT